MEEDQEENCGHPPGMKWSETIKDLILESPDRLRDDDGFGMIFMIFNFTLFP